MPNSLYNSLTSESQHDMVKMTDLSNEKSISFEQISILQSTEAWINKIKYFPNPNNSNCVLTYQSVQNNMLFSVMTRQFCAHLLGERERKDFLNHDSWVFPANGREVEEGKKSFKAEVIINFNRGQNSNTK